MIRYPSLGADSKMNRELKSLIRELFPGENLKYALAANDYDLALGILIEATDTFIEEFGARNIGANLVKAFKKNSLDMLQRIFWICEKIYFLEAATNVVDFFADLKSTDRIRVKSAYKNTALFFSDLTALNDIFHYNYEDVEAFLLALLQYGRSLVKEDTDEEESDVDYIDLMGAFLEQKPEELAELICNIKTEALKRQHSDTEKSPE